MFRVAGSGQRECYRRCVNYIYGDVNPSGKLGYTIAKDASDYPATVTSSDESDNTEGVYVDYKYFDAKNISARYPFGHGLSCTTFGYGNISAEITNAAALSSPFPSGSLVKIISCQRLAWRAGEGRFSNEAIRTLESAMSLPTPTVPSCPLAQGRPRRPWSLLEGRGDLLTTPQLVNYDPDAL